MSRVEAMAEELATAAANQTEVRSVGLVDEDVLSGGAFFDIALHDGTELTVLVTRLRQRS